MRAKSWASPLVAAPTAVILALALVVRAAPAAADDFPTRPITILIPHDAIKAAIKSPDIGQQMITMGLIPIDTLSVDEFQHFVKSEIGHWGDLVRKIGIAGTE